MSIEPINNEILNKIADEINITPNQYKIAINRFNAVKDWLYEIVKDDVPLLPKIYLQGSLNLGTIIKPLSFEREKEYDVDMVCEFILDKTEYTKQMLKDIVKKRLSDHEKYGEMLDEEGRRCWTLHYADKNSINFHVDILPAIKETENIILDIIIQGVDRQYADSAIAITNINEDGLYEWKTSNPTGYAGWFRNKNQIIYNRVKDYQMYKLFEDNRSVFKTESEVSELVRTPLQKAIQILKHHRNYLFNEHELSEFKPISIIITTLAAHFYNNEETVYDALKNIINNIERFFIENYSEYLEESKSLTSDFIKREENFWTITNPVNKSENFADRWMTDNRKRENAFFIWVKDLKNLLKNVANITDKKLLIERYKGAFGDNILDKLTEETSYKPPIVKINNLTKPWGNE